MEKIHTDDLTNREIIVVFNQKGGVGKTTTAVNISVCLSLLGMRTLLIDLDSQSNATQCCGLQADCQFGSYDLLMGTATVEQASRDTNISGMRVCAADDKLAGVDLELASAERPQFKLSEALAKEVGIDYVVIDCPPTLGMLPINALASATIVLIPVTPEPLSHAGLHRAWKHIMKVKSHLNNRLDKIGILMTMVDDKDKTRSDVDRAIHAEFGTRVLPIRISRDNAMMEASGKNLPVVISAPNSSGTRNYLDLAELLISWKSASADGKGYERSEDQDIVGRAMILDDIQKIRKILLPMSEHQPIIVGIDPENPWQEPASLPRSPASFNGRHALIIAICGIGLAIAAVFANHMMHAVNLP
ncbi:MAG: ParA family protein [Alphaproteobacteria bacterium]|nr:ParA family protein [Alphaproteobacteria bacterium]